MASSESPKSDGYWDSISQRGSEQTSPFVDANSFARNGTAEQVVALEPDVRFRLMAKVMRLAAVTARDERIKTKEVRDAERAVSEAQEGLAILQREAARKAEEHKDWAATMAAFDQMLESCLLRFSHVLLQPLSEARETMAQALRLLDSGKRVRRTDADDNLSAVSSASSEFADKNLGALKAKLQMYSLAAQQLDSSNKASAQASPRPTAHAQPSAPSAPRVSPRLWKQKLALLHAMQRYRADGTRPTEEVAVAFLKAVETEERYRTVRGQEDTYTHMLCRQARECIVPGSELLWDRLDYLFEQVPGLAKPDDESSHGHAAAASSSAAEASSANAPDAPSRKRPLEPTDHDA